MNETIVSPGVFANENDQTFIAQGVLNIGAAIVGPTEKGPAFIPTVIKNGFNEFTTRFGKDTTSTYVPLTVKTYLDNASAVTITRVLGNGGYTFSSPRTLAALVISGSGTGTNGHGNEILAVFHPSKNTSPNSLGLEKSTLTPTSGSISGSFILQFSGSALTAQNYSASVKQSNPNYILRSVGSNADNSLSGSVYKATAFPYINFRELQNSSTVSGSLIMLVTSSVDMAFTSSYSEGYSEASTPWITDGNVTGARNLFRALALSHGTSTNTDVYLSINGLIEPADINGIEQYSKFNVLVRKVGDTDNQPSIVEQYIGVDLNPASPNFIARMIGDKYSTYNNTLQKVISNGNYSNKSNYIRIEMGDGFNADLTVSSLSPKASPRGFERFYQTMIGFAGYNLPPVTYKTTETVNNVFSNKAFLGFDFTLQDNFNYLKPVPTTIAGASTYASQSAFTVNSLYGHASASYVGSLSASVDLSGVTGPKSEQLQFSVAMQGGFDGMNPSTLKYIGGDIVAGNVFGFDCSTAGSAGSLAFNKALSILSNSDEYDLNLLAVPGILQQLHSSVTQTAMDMVNDRGDAFYIMDLAGLNATITQATSVVDGIDQNYAGVYYPWVKILDTNTNRPTFVPPSVVVPGAFSYNDANGAEWLAPAGLGRGSLTSVIELKNNLTKAERDTLYSGRVNPILKFPGQGVVIWGQKNLQINPSAVDRINVRRLLIKLKKFISSSSRYLVFEGNSTVTRNKFLSIVNPYLESIVQREGLYTFRVVMDGSNNTSDIIDRKTLVGAIYLQPTITAEYIILDFNIMPTGAIFGQ